VGPPRLGLGCDVDLFPNSLSQQHTTQVKSPLQTTFDGLSFTLIRLLRIRTTSPSLQDTTHLERPRRSSHPKKHIQDVEDLVYGMRDEGKPLAGHG
jgi:hypothetical protein